MSPRRWILLLIFYISYLMFGASIYYHIEHGLEKQRRAEELKERIEIHEYLLDQLVDKNVTTQDEILQKITDYCEKPVTDYKDDEFEPPYTWTFYHSFFFAFTVCSTVGYGNISPSSTLGRMIMIAYSVIGIPINGILFAGLGEYFGRTFQAIYRRYKKYKISNDVRYMPPQLGLITTVLIALIPGVTFFIFLPSWVFSYFEDWPYSLAVYYSYVTTTTIGFGDYVPTFQTHQPYKFGGWFIVYEIFVIVWFIFSLGYLLMIMTFITRGLQSKKLAYLEQQLSSNIKSTQNRIWNGVIKDVGYLRRILNELYILKFKPVYTDSDISHFLHRSNSCPELSMYRVETPPVVVTRKRAFSECFSTLEARDGNATQPLRTASDSDLDKFDRQKSFESAEAFRHTTGLLAKVVSALAAVKPPDEDFSDMYGAYHGFSDSQILASEWSIPNAAATQPPPHRGRACSDFNITPRWKVLRPVQNEWTWSGDNNQIQQAINNRVRHTNDSANLYQTNFAHQPLDYVVHVDNTNDDFGKPRVKKFSIPDGLRRLFPFKKRSSQSESVADMPPAPTERKFSVMSVPESTQHTAPPLDYYSTVTASASPTYFRRAQLRRPPALPTIQQSPPSTAETNITDDRMHELCASESSLSSRLSAAAAPNGSGNTFDAEQSFQYNASLANQRSAAVAGATTRKRRESIFTQNPAISARRGSIFPPTSAQRRGSLFSAERRGSNVSSPATAAAVMMPRRSSMFPNERRPSLFSVASAEDRGVLENTSLADLIRALEAMHTQAVLEEAACNSLNASSSHGGYSKNDRKKRQTGSLDLPELPPLLTLFASGDNNKLLTTAAVNRLYARRSTVVGTMPNTATTSAAVPLQQAPSTSSRLTRRRLSSVHNNEPPPSYSEKEATATATSTKFKRRFSIRPTALQIPPGKAPPPGVNINSTPQTSSVAASSAPSSTTNTSQTVLQRRLSLRPSPLARETTAKAPSSSSDESAAIVSASSPALNITSRMPSATSTTRLLPPTSARVTPSMTSSTHSPLSRIVQISQAQRKSSMPDGFTLKKPEEDR